MLCAIIIALGRVPASAGGLQIFGVALCCACLFGLPAAEVGGVLLQGLIDGALNCGRVNKQTVCYLHTICKRWNPTERGVKWFPPEQPIKQNQREDGKIITSTSAH